MTIRRDTVKPAKPKIKGGKGLKRRGKRGKPLPPKKRIKCKSKDRTAGLKSCRIKGYKTKPGRHMLKAIATDRAGLKSKRTLRYVVKRRSR